MTDVVIEGRRIAPDEPCFVIAEVGVNHNGNVETALAMVDAIAEAGADCVKFQTFKADEFVSNPDETYEYISQGKTVRESQLEMFRRLELKREEFAKLFQRARDRGLVPLSTPADRAAVDLLDGLQAGAFKIGSDDLVYTPFLEYVASKGKPIILSTGMADLEDVARAVETVRRIGNDRIVVSLYPTPIDSLNLRRIPELAQRFGDPVGFSDHSDGIQAALAAVALGATVVEKHFTLDRNMPGPDHRFSADPRQLADMVAAIRTCEASLGSPEIVPAEGEVEMREIARRSIVARRDLQPGETISADDLAYQRPGSGLMPYESHRVIGKRVRVAINAGKLITLNAIDD